MITAGLADGLTSLDATQTAIAYVAIVMLVAADAVFPFLPGETTVITGATLASQGMLNIVIVFVAAWIGALMGDLLLFGIGRVGSERLQGWFGRAIGRDRQRRANDFMRRFGRPFLILGRFVPGLRVVTALSAGTLQLTLRHYLSAELIGSGLWALYASVLGYTVGSKLGGSLWLSIAVALGVTVVLSATVGFLYKRAGSAADTPADDART